MACDDCGHDWHGLRCSHEQVVRDGWWLKKVTCDCADD